MKYKRWNFEANDRGVSVCRDNHKKGQPCEYEELSPTETLIILNDMRSEILKNPPQNKSVEIQCPFRDENDEAQFCKIEFPNLHNLGLYVGDLLTETKSYEGLLNDFNKLHQNHNKN